MSFLSFALVLARTGGAGDQYQSFRHLDHVAEHGWQAQLFETRHVARDVPKDGRNAETVPEEVGAEAATAGKLDGKVGVVGSLPGVQPLAPIG